VCTRRCTLRCEFLKYIFPQPGSSHLYVRRWAVGEDGVLAAAAASVSVEDRQTGDDATVDDVDCLGRDGGAGAMGQRRLELGDSGNVDAVAQLTTMIAAGADDSGTSMPLTLVRTTGRETALLAATLSPPSPDTATVGCEDDKAKRSSVDSLPDDIICTHTGVVAVDCGEGLLCPGACDDILARFSTSLGNTDEEAELAESRERLRVQLAAAAAD